MSVYEELLNLTDMEPNDGSEDSQEHLNNLVHAVGDLLVKDDSNWDKLSQEATEWYQEAAQILNEDDSDEDLPEPEGYQEAIQGEEAEEEDDDEEEEEVVEKKKPAAKAKAKLKAKAKPKPKPKAKAKPVVEEAEEVEEQPARRVIKPKVPNEAKLPGAWFVRKVMSENIDLTLNEVVAETNKRLEEAYGGEMKTKSVQVIYLNTRRFVEAVVEHGVVKDKQGKVIIKKA